MRRGREFQVRGAEKRKSRDLSVASNCHCASVRCWKYRRRRTDAKGGDASSLSEVAVGASRCVSASCGAVRMCLSPLVRVSSSFF